MYYKYSNKGDGGLFMDNYRLAEDYKFEQIEQMAQKKKVQRYITSLEQECIVSSEKDNSYEENSFLTIIKIILVAVVVLSVVFAVRFGINNYSFNSSYDDTGGSVTQFLDKGFVKEDNDLGHLSVEYLKNLDPYVWNTLTSKEKFDTINAVIVNEQYNLGVVNYNQAVFKVEDLDDRLWGTYWHFDKSITIDKYHLENDDVYDVINTACHETRHLYQHTMIDLYENKDKDWKNLATKEDIQAYKNDFDNYVSALDGDEYFDEYYNQYVEIDAREYGSNRAEYYMSLVNYYL